MDTLVQLNDGTETTISDLKEQQVEPAPNPAIIWEAMRLLIHGLL